MKQTTSLFAVPLFAFFATAATSALAEEAAGQPRIPPGQMTAAVTEITSTRDPASAPTSAVSDGIAAPTPVGEWYTGVAGEHYFTAGGTPPVFHLDLGADRDIGGVAVTNFASHSNRVAAMKMRFATAAETTGGFGASIEDREFSVPRRKQTWSAENMTLLLENRRQFLSAA